MPQRQAIRDYAKSKGYLDDDITYDNGTVLLKGKRLIDATPEADGRTYADTRSLDQAYGRYDVQNQQAALRSQSTQPDPELSVYRKTIQDRINKPIQQFSYNQSTDPAYQNAVQQAQTNAATAQNNTLANLRARGQGKSSYSETVANQIQQKELGNVTANVLPQLINQAYQRYAGQQQLENQQTGNMLGLYGTMSNENQQRYNNAYNLMNQQNTMNQQDIVNDRNDTQDQRQKRLDNTAVQQWYQQQYGIPFVAKDDWNLVAEQAAGKKTVAQQKQEADQQKLFYDNAVKQFESIGTATPEIARILGIPEGTTTQQARYQQGQLGIQQQNASASAARESRLATPKPVPEKKANLNSLTSSLRSQFTRKDSDGNITVSDPQGLEAAILSQPMSDQEYAYLYNYFGLQIPQ